MKYQLKKRAERQGQTRRRIVEAALALHGEVGPSRTSISAIAERAGVQRHTVYSHFPDERELFMACSGLFTEQHPPPDPDGLLAVAAGEQRLRAALEGLYAYFTAHERLMANVHRDLEVDEAVRAAQAARMGPVVARLHEVLADGLPGDGARTAAALAVATSFWTWRTLARDRGLEPAAAAAVSAAMVLGAA